jgi:hypothetical protein
MAREVPLLPPPTTKDSLPKQATCAHTSDTTTYCWKKGLRDCLGGRIGQCTHHQGHAQGTKQDALQAPGACRAATWCTVIISSEMRTSQECDTCKAQVYHPRRRKLPFCGYCGCDDASCKVCMATPCHTCKKRKRRFSRISCCRQCKTMRDRDLAAAANIKDLFWDIVLVASK